MAFATRGVLLSVLLVAGAADGLADGWEPDATPSIAYHAYQPEVMSWTGFYVGGNVGFSYTTSSFDHAATPLPACTLITGSIADCSTTGALNSNGLIGGIQAGFNHQVGSFIWGLEGDVTWRGQDTGKATFIPAFGVVQDFAESNGWLATLRPRVGFAYYRAFIYATGGVAWGSVSHTLTFRDPLNVFPTLVTQESSTRVGWTTGVGVEYALTTHWTFRGEYLFVDLGEVNVATAATGGWWPTNTTLAEQQHLLRAALNYRF
jgi:outer membrane immunogenic protein